MASEPNQTLDEMLRAYAQQRGKDAPSFELPPATRRALLAEAARRYGPAASGRVFVWDWLRGWRRRLVYALAAAAVLAALVWRFVPKGPHPAQLAQRTSALRAEEKEKDLTPSAHPVELATAPPPAAPAVAEPAPERGQRWVREATDKTSAPLASTGPQARLADRTPAEKPQDAATGSARKAPAPPAQPVIRPAAPASAATLKPKAGLAEPAPAPTSLASVVAGVARQAQNLPASRQRFEQALSAAGPQAGARPIDAAPVLRSFELERAGNHLRLIDADGSVYEGELVAGLDATRARPDQPAASDLQQTHRLSGPLLKQQPILEKARRGLAQEQEEFAVFRASGTNRTLNLPVVIEAGFVPAPQVQAASGPVFLGAAGNIAPTQQAAPAPVAGPALSFAQTAANQSPAKPSAPAQSQANLGQGMSIQGRVRIGGTNELPLDARPVVEGK